MLPEAWQQLLNQSFSIDQAANRQGYRLHGSTLPHHQLSLPSFGVVPGAIQLPPDGRPILLMADAQPTGGYPVIAVVISADLPLAAQLLPATVCLSPKPIWKLRTRLWPNKPHGSPSAQQMKRATGC